MFTTHACVSSTHSSDLTFGIVFQPLSTEVDLKNLCGGCVTLKQPLMVSLTLLLETSGSCPAAINNVEERNSIEEGGCMAGERKRQVDAEKEPVNEGNRWEARGMAIKALRECRKFAEIIAPSAILMHVVASSIAALLFFK